MTAPAAEPDRALDSARVRRLFSRRRLLASDDFLQREVARRLLERLATVRIEAAWVLDVGCGAGADLPALRTRFADASVAGLDGAGPRLRRNAADEKPQGLSRFFRRSGGATVQADFAALPFAAQQFDVLWSNLALHWSAEPHRVLPEWARVTRVGGLVAFSAFGPDTLREVAEAFAEVDGDRHVIPFTDMHDYGDMLVESGYTTPVVDMERLTLTYSSARHLWADVRALGGNPFAGQRRYLRTRRYGERVGDALARTRDADGRYRLTFELLFAHAWKGAPRTTRQGESIVHFDRER